jgi:hypothetical protein
MMKWSMILVVAAASCLSISCGPGGDDSGNPDNSGAELPLLDGLDTDADNQRLRFYVDTTQEAPGLFAFDPAQPEAGGVLVDGDMSLIRPHFAMIPSGTVDTSLGQISDYQTAHIYYTVWGTLPEDNPVANRATYGEQRRVSTDPAKLGDEPIPVSTTTLSAPVFTNSARFRAFNLRNPLESSVVVRSPYQGGWIRVRPSYDATREPDFFGEFVKVIGPVWGPDVQQNSGWLVANTDDDAQGGAGALKRLDDDLNEVGQVRYKDSGEVVENVQQTRYLQDFGDGSVLVALGINDDAVGDVWLYESSSEEGNAGTIASLQNQQGEPLLISAGALGIDDNDQSVAAPASNLTSVTNDAYYFAQGPGLVNLDWTKLFRIDHDGWAVYDHADYTSAETTTANVLSESDLAPFLLGLGGDRLFWSLGRQTEIVDVSSSDPTQWTRTPVDAPGGAAEATTVYAVTNGWVYYNTGDSEAVALNLDTGESVALDDARWIGASSSGSTSTLNGRVKQAGISEVFVLRDSQQLAAVAAANPLEGMVILGELDAPAEGVRLFGTAPGPHRLAQVENDDETFEVVYMNTRNKDSLRTLTPAPVVDWEMPLESGTSIDISASGTRPLGRF